ncbi:MAG: hypothetical protein HOP28_03510 [Gemmatimonadales bacterium]|nr:hypothetical protein [Gemmatimonadales bacterium]
MLFRRSFAGILGGLALATTLAGAQALPTWTFTQELRIGDEADGPTLFADLRGLQMDGRGRLPQRSG